MGIDKDDSGEINAEEMIASMDEMGITADEAEVRAMIAMHDADGDGRLDLKEFLAAMLDGQSHLQEDALLDAFDRIDSDDSGFISFENLRDLLGRQFSPQLVQQMIADADFKENGVIDYEEFKQMMLGSRPARRLADEAASE